MKLEKKSGIYKASNLTYSPIENIAFSYDWYQLLKTVKGKLILNSFPYSDTTRRQISKLKAVLDSEGKKYLMVDIPKGLQDENFLSDSIGYYKTKIKNLKEKIKKARKPEKYPEELTHLIAKWYDLRNLSRNIV